MEKSLARGHRPAMPVWAMAVAILLLAGGLSGCIGGPDGGPRATKASPNPDIAAAGDPQAPSPGAMKIGTGSVKIALILPLSGPGATVGTALRNAAELAVEDFQKPDLQILVKDDRGSPDGAREAAQAALSEGAELVLGPLFAANVQAAAGVTRAAGKPIIAFSTDASVAARSVYLLSFLPQTEVDG